jgi:hypothetical protein
VAILVRVSGLALAQREWPAAFGLQHDLGAKSIYYGVYLHRVAGFNSIARLPDDGGEAIPPA